MKLKQQAAGCGLSRQSAKATMEDSIERHKREIKQLETLIRVIPWDSLSKDDEEDIWSLFLRMR